MFFGSLCYVPEMDAYAHFIGTAINGQSSNLNIAPEGVNEEMDEERQSKSFKEFIVDHMNSAVLFTTGSTVNTFYCPDFLFHLKKDFLPQVMLWTEMLLGLSVMHNITLDMCKD